MSGTVHVVVPDALDDHERVSGGNVYDRRVIDGLRGAGWSVIVHPVDAALRGADAAFAAIPDAALAMIDGLIAVSFPEAIERASARVRMIVLAHMVAGTVDESWADGEARVLAAVDHVVATSGWTRDELVRRRLVAPGDVTVAMPGSDPAPISRGSREGMELLFVGAVSWHKGVDVLVDALGSLPPRTRWRCTIAGSRTADPGFARAIEQQASDRGIADRLAMDGVLSGSALAAAYRRADVLVAPSRAEGYGMAIADAVSRGIPVVASDVGGIPATVARGAALLVAPGDAEALRGALTRWMTDPALRARLRRNAASARGRVPRWSDTLREVAVVLEGER